MVKKKFKFHWIILISDPKQRSGARLLTPTVVSMAPLIIKSIDEFLDIVAPYADRNLDVDVRSMYTRLSMDVLCK